MGKGDKKTRKGKIILGSYGKKRRKKRTPLYVAPVKKKTVKKEVSKDAPKVVKESVKKEATEKNESAPAKKEAPKAKSQGPKADKADNGDLETSKE